MFGRAKNVAEKERLERALVEAKEMGGDIEVMDGTWAIASFQARIGDKSAAYAALDAVFLLHKVSTSRRIDTILFKLRVALFHLVNRIEILNSRSYVI